MKDLDTPKNTPPYCKGRAGWSGAGIFIHTTDDRSKQRDNSSPPFILAICKGGAPKNIAA